MCIDWRDGIQMSVGIGDVLTSLPRSDAKRLRRNLQTHAGRQELRELLMGFYRLTPGARAAVTDRLLHEPVLCVCPAQAPEPDSSA